MVRTAMTLIVVWLLKIPGLQFVGGVLWASFVKNHRRLESRISARLASFARLRAAGSPAPNAFQGGHVMLEASVTNRVLELTTVPVEVIAGDAVSNLERYGIPAGIGAATAPLLVAAD